MTTESIATIQSALFGGDTGNAFNDLETVIGGSANITINSVQPITSILIAHGDAVDGIAIKYYLTSKTTTYKYHGTDPQNKTDSNLNVDTITLNSNDTIVAISGLQDANSPWGNRIIALSFTTYNSNDGKMTVHGPYGGSTGTAFRVTANGYFLAFGGRAIDTTSSLADLANQGTDEGTTVNGGLYGLTFTEIAYRKV
ncbi:hypothetical protein C8R45DRAFT_1171678 [Mycena sanguinolenta]|nr:hypothetical protein C8R45DRAFT_1171678 [Mycena sanguinolenta]